MRLEFYVLHYNIKTSGYGNEIVFMSFKDAMEVYINEKPFNELDRVELVYSPIQNEDNVVIISKGASPISLNS